MKKKYILITLLIISIIFISTYSLYNFDYNNQLNLNSLDEIIIYKFKEGIGFVDYKAQNSQKKAIWNMMNNMTPCKNITLKPKAGGYFAFYIMNNNKKTVFHLVDLQNDKLYITTFTVDKNGKVSNTRHFMSCTHYAKKIKNIILNYD